MSKLKHSILSALNNLGLMIKQYHPRNSEEAMLMELIKRHQMDLVLDIGANTGQFVKRLRKKGYKGDVISCEPLKEAFKILEQNAEYDARWETNNFAIGKAYSTQKINVTSNSFSSSLYEINQVHQEAAETSSMIGMEEVQVVPLKKVYSNVGSERKVLLKIDTQGYEMEVIEGAEEELTSIAVILVELSMVPLFKGGPVYTDVIHKLETLGFELFHIFPEFVHPKTSRLLQANGFFVRNTISTS